MVQVAIPRAPWALLLVLLGACAREAPLATLEGRTLTDGDLQRHLACLYSADERRAIRENPARRQGALHQWLDMLAISAKARRLGIDSEARFAKAVELMEMRTLGHLLTEKNRARIESITRISPEEVRRFYDEHKGEYISAPAFTMRQILVYVRGNPAFPERGWGPAEARVRAQRASRQLRAGQSWDVVARRFSDDLSNNQRGGLIREGQFGLYAPEVERAVRTQELGRPGELVKSIFGYHVLQVESRSLEGTPRPYAQIEPLLRDRLAAIRAEQAHGQFVDPIALDMGLKVTEVGARDVSLLDEGAVAAGEVLAEMAGREILESDFRWFLKDAFPASQRQAVFSRPGARKNLLASFLDALVLEAKARKDGLDRSPEFQHQHAMMRQSLLTEFVQEHDKTGPFCQCQQTPEERRTADRRYLDQVRAEVGLRVIQL